AFAGDHLRPRSDNDVDVGLHVGIASLADGGNAPILDGNIGLHNPPVIENERIGDHRINCTFDAGPLRLTHTVTDDFPASKLHLLPVGRKILFHLDDEIGIGKAHLVADRWSEHLRVAGTAHSVGHSTTSVIEENGHGAGSAPMTAWSKP